MSTFAAARSCLRSAAGRTALGSRISSGARSKPPSSPFRIPKPNQNRLSRPLFRSAIETSRCLESMLPYHTATASALLTSMLSVSCRTHSWNPEGSFVLSLVFMLAQSYKIIPFVVFAQIAMMMYDECQNGRAKTNVLTP